MQKSDFNQGLKTFKTLEIMRTFKITSLHSVYIDNWAEGEQENVNNYDLSQEIKANNWKEAIKKYFETVLYFSFNEKYCDIDQEQNCVFYSNLVDRDNTEIKNGDYDYKLWKEGEKTLYANNTTIYINELTKTTLTND